MRGYTRVSKPGNVPPSTNFFGRLVTQAQGSQNAEKSVSGVFTWQPSGNAITLDERGGRQQFSVGEGRLTLVRSEGRSPQSPAATRVLTRAAPHGEDLEQQLGRYRWTLAFATDANNRRIAGLPPGQDRPVVLSFAGSQLSVQGPCNRLIGGYEVSAANRLRQRRRVHNDGLRSGLDAFGLRSVQPAGQTAASPDDRP